VIEISFGEESVRIPAKVRPPAEFVPRELVVAIGIESVEVLPAAW
jgi:hypothetical protein